MTFAGIGQAVAMLHQAMQHPSPTTLLLILRALKVSLWSYCAEQLANSAIGRRCFQKLCDLSYSVIQLRTLQCGTMGLCHSHDADSDLCCQRANPVISSFSILLVNPAKTYAGGDACCTRLDNLKSCGCATQAAAFNACPVGFNCKALLSQGHG